MNVIPLPQTERQPRPVTETDYCAAIECEVLATLLMNDGSLPHIAGFLLVEHFIARPHQILYEAIRKAFDAFGSVSPVLVGDILAADDRRYLDLTLDPDARGYLAHLSANAVYGSPYLVRSACAVVEQWGRLELMNLTAEFWTHLAQVGADPRAELADYQAAAQPILAELAALPSAHHPSHSGASA